MKWFRGTEKKITEKVKEENTHYSSSTSFRADSLYYVQNRKKGLRKVCALIRQFFLNLHTVFCTNCTDKEGGERWRRGFLGPCHTSLIKSKNIPANLGF